MQRRFHHSIVRLIAGSLLLALPLGQVLGQQRLSSPEYVLKAAFIYKFALFTTLPNAPAKKNLTLCILGRDPFGTTIDELDGKEVDAATLSVRRIASASAKTNCQILFVAESEVTSYLSSTTPGKDDIGILTITDKEGAARQGIMIELSTAEKKLGFEFNQDVARSNQVQISSKLLRLARKVY